MTTYTNRPDDKFYWVTENEDKTFTAIPKEMENVDAIDENGNPIFVKVYDPTANGGKGAMVETTTRLVNIGLKSNFITQAKRIANSLLSQTVWMVIRKAERNIDISADVTNYRNSVLAEENRLETAISSVTTVDELASISFNFPSQY